MTQITIQPDSDSDSDSETDSDDVGKYRCPGCDAKAIEYIGPSEPSYQCTACGNEWLGDATKVYNGDL